MRPFTKAVGVLAIASAGWFGHSVLTEPETVTVVEEKEGDPIIVPDIKTNTVTVEVPAELSNECRAYITATEESVDAEMDIGAAAPRLSLILSEIQRLATSPVNSDPARMVELQEELKEINFALIPAEQILGRQARHPVGPNPCTGE